jgi:hypothetical protein
VREIGIAVRKRERVARAHGVADPRDRDDTGAAAGSGNQFARSFAERNRVDGYDEARARGA